MAFKQIDNGFAPSASDIFETGVAAGEACWNVPNPRLDKHFVKVYLPLYAYIEDSTLETFREGFHEGRRRAGGKA